MNINCIICSDTVLPSSEIYATLCGHLFHYACLIQWIERSKTCPQCRNKVTEETVHRIYFNLTNTDHIIDDVATLQNKIDNFEFQISLKAKDIKNLTEKYKKTKNQNILLRKEISELENKMRVHDSLVSALKDQISFFKSKSKEKDRLVEEIEKMKSKLKDVELVQIAINGTREEVNETLKSENDPESLVILAASLKKALLDTEKKKITVEHKFKQLQNDVTKYRKDINFLESSNEKLRKEIELLKTNCGQEKEYLTNMVLDVHGMSSDKNISAIKRILCESPIPLLPKSSGNVIETTSSNVTQSPSVEEKVVHILDSNSPYLPVHTNSINIDCELVKNGISPSARKMSIFKRPIQRPRSFDLSKTNEIVYNGLGGQSKEDMFPVPKTFVLGSKKHKANSSISMSSAKFRKFNSFVCPKRNNDKL